MHKNFKRHNQKTIIIIHLNIIKILMKSSMKRSKKLIDIPMISSMKQMEKKHSWADNQIQSMRSQDNIRNVISKVPLTPPMKKTQKFSKAPKKDSLMDNGAKTQRSFTDESNRKTQKIKMIASRLMADNISIDSSKYMLITEKQPDICSIHKKPLDVICLNDKELVCSHCILFNASHKKHTIVSEQQFCNTLQTQNIQFYSFLLQNNYLDNQTTDQQKKSKITQQRSEILKQLQNKKYKLIKQIRNDIKQIIEDVRNLETQLITQLTISVGNLQSYAMGFQSEEESQEQEFMLWVELAKNNLRKLQTPQINIQTKLLSYDPNLIAKTKTQLQKVELSKANNNLLARELVEKLNVQSKSLDTIKQKVKKCFTINPSPYKKQRQQTQTITELHVDKKQIVHSNNLEHKLLGRVESTGSLEKIHIASPLKYPSKPQNKMHTNFSSTILSGRKQLRSPSLSEKFQKPTKTVVKSTFKEKLKQCLEDENTDQLDLSNSDLSYFDSNKLNMIMSTLEQKTFKILNVSNCSITDIGFQNILELCNKLQISHLKAQKNKLTEQCLLLLKKYNNGKNKHLLVNLVGNKINEKDRKTKAVINQMRTKGIVLSL